MANRPFTQRRLDSWGSLAARLRQISKVNKFRTVLVDDLTSYATGSITFNVNPANNDTITLGGTVVTFGGAGPHPAGNIKDSLTALVTFLNASNDANISKSTYSASSPALAIKYKTPGIKTFTLAASVAVRSGPTLSLNQIYKRVPV